MPRTALLICVFAAAVGACESMAIPEPTEAVPTSALAGTAEKVSTDDGWGALPPFPPELYPTPWSTPTTCGNCTPPPPTTLVDPMLKPIWTLGGPWMTPHPTPIGTWPVPAPTPTAMAMPTSGGTEPTPDPTLAKLLEELLDRLPARTPNPTSYFITITPPPNPPTAIPPPATP